MLSYSELREWVEQRCLHNPRLLRIILYHKGGPDIHCNKKSHQIVSVEHSGSDEQGMGGLFIELSACELKGGVFKWPRTLKVIFRGFLNLIKVLTSTYISLPLIDRFWWAIYHWKEECLGNILIDQIFYFRKIVGIKNKWPSGHHEKWKKFSLFNETRYKKFPW